MSGRTTAAAALGLGLAWAGAALAQETVKIGVILPYSGPFADAANQLEAGIELYIAAARRRGRRQEDRDHPQGHRRPGPGRRQAPGAGAGRARRRRHPRRLRADARGAGRAPTSPTEAEKLMVVMNAATSIVTEQSPYDRAHLADHPAGQLCLWQVGRPRRRRQAGLHAGRRLWPRPSTPRPRSPRASPRPAAPSSAPTARRWPNPDFSAFVQRVKDANPEAVYIFVPGGAPAGGHRQGAGRPRPDPARHQGASRQGELTHPEALESMGDTARRHHHHLPLHAGARRSAQQRLRRGLPRGQQRPQPRPVLDRRL